jgi:hypothetical protein
MVHRQWAPEKGNMSKVSLLVACFMMPSSAVPAFPLLLGLGGKPYTVSYGGRSLKLNGDRSPFLSGTMHYPRGMPEMWDRWFELARNSSLNMIEAYVFWNYNEPVEGQYNFEGNANLTDFVRRAASYGLFANLRIGPYACAEWSYGGLPAWLGEKPGQLYIPWPGRESLQDIRGVLPQGGVTPKGTPRRPSSLRC